jgi:dienelactone hydrolase
MRLFIVLFSLMFSLLPAAAQERVSIPLPDGQNLNGVLFMPAGAGPFPAVVALHGCGGLVSGSSIISGRHKDWGYQLAAQGYMVLFPDSFSSRGLGSQCVVRDRTVRPGKERVIDAVAAKAWLQQRADVMAQRVSLLGWSNGASSVLWSVGRDKKPRDERPDFNAAVAFYPGCRLVAQSAERRDWESRLPLLILIGEADTWTPPEPCRQLVKIIRDYGRDAVLVTYPNAVHEFDHPDRKPTRRTGLAFTGDDSGEAMVATDPAARADALLRVPAFLKR